MKKRSAIRMAARVNGSHPAHIEAVNRLFDRLDSAGIPYEVRIEGVETGGIGSVWGRAVADRLDFSRLARGFYLAADLRTAPREGPPPP